MNILNAHVIDIDSTVIVVELVTNKDLRQYERSYYAYHVYLSCRPSSTVISSEYENPGKPWKFPFDASFIESQPCGTGRYCSRWTLPIADKSNLNLNTYKYVLRPADSVRLRIGGGTMGGGSLRSNVAVVEVP